MSRKETKSNGKPTQAEKADRYALYLASVQEPGNEVAFFRRVYRKEFGRLPRVLREDFCGAAAVCYEWVKRRPECRAIGVDIDPEPLEWGRVHIAPKLPEPARQRVTLVQDDVRTVRGRKADVVAAQNFSFWVFKTRDELRAYFEAAYRNLRRRGVMVLDMMGGSECLEEDREEETDQGRFTYVWEQARFDPITHDCSYYIHFRFRDGSELRRVFGYRWRMWTIPEVRELLLEAGFKRVDVYWEGTGPDGEGNDVYTVRKRAASDPAWIAYMAAVK